MEIGAISNILKNVLGRAETAFSKPTRTLSTHLRKPSRVAVHPLRHEMTANTRQSTATFGDHR